MTTKNTLLLLLIVLYIVGCTDSLSKKKGEKKNFTPPEFNYSSLENSKIILQELFSSKEYDSQGNIIWTASKIDFPEIPISYDNRYHTSIDTTIYFEDTKGDSCAILIFANYNIQLEKGKEVQAGSHFDPVSLGIALFVKGNKGWDLFKIKKHLTELGYGGTYRTGRQDAGKISLKKFGDHWVCLSFKQGIGGNTGVFWGYERFFSVERNLPECQNSQQLPYAIDINAYEIFTQIFSFSYHHNYYYPDLDNQNSTDMKLSTIPDSCGLFKILLDVQEENYHIETNKINSRNKSTREFIFSPALNIYLEKEPPKSK